MKNVVTITKYSAAPFLGVASAAPCCASSILRLTLKKKWFDQIAAGIKKEEYREPDGWILSRILGREYEVIEFKNGYGANVPTMHVEYLGCRYGKGKTGWGAKIGKSYVILKLGKVLSLHNDERVHHYQRVRASITGLRVELR